MIRTLPHLPWLLVGLLVSAQDSHVPPLMGEVASPLEEVYWYYHGESGQVPALKELRGEVVLVHTWGYYCGPCIKEGVPYVVDLVRANAERGLRALSITVGVGDGKPDDHFVTVGREMGMDHPLGIADGFGTMTPYLNLNKSKSLTWCFVIGREGGVRWAGDPSNDDEEFLEAVRAALAEEARPPLDERSPEPLKKAIAGYIDGNLAKARDEAAKVATKYAKKSGDEAIAVNGYAAQLLKLIDEHRADLERRLDDAAAARDAEAFVAARGLLLARFPKTDAAKRIKTLERDAKEDSELVDAIEAWSAWHELRDARPALFPARDDKDNQRFAKRLEKYVEGASPELPGLDHARAMLAAYAANRSR